MSLISWICLVRQPNNVFVAYVQQAGNTLPIVTVNIGITMIGGGSTIQQVGVTPNTVTGVGITVTQVANVIIDRLIIEKNFKLTLASFLIWLA